MALICVTGRRDPIEISNDRAKVLKEKWLDEKTPKDKRLDLDIWAGTYGQIKTIELTSERRYTSDDYYQPPTDHQRKATTQNLEQLGDWVKRQTWFKESERERHYTKEHAYKRCVCTKPKDWLFDVIEVR